MAVKALADKVQFKSEQFSAFLNSLTDALIIVDSDFNVIFVNQTFVQKFPELNQLLNFENLITFLNLKFRLIQTSQHIKEAIQENDHSHYTLPIATPDRDTIFLEFIADYDKTHSGGACYYVFFRKKSGNPIEKQLLHFDILKRIIQNIHKIESINGLVNYVVKTLHQNKFSYHHVSVFLRERVNRKELLRLVACEGKSKEYFRKYFPKGYFQGIDQGIMGQVIATGEIVFERNVQENPCYHSLPDFVSASELCIPIKDEKQVLGAINIESENAIDLDETDVQMVNAVADIMGLAIKNIRKAEELKRSYQEMEKYVSDLQESKERLESQSFELVAALEKAERAQKLLHLQKKNLEKDLRIGAELQKSLLPKRLPEDCQIKIDSVYIPTLQLGGDFFDIKQLDDSYVAILIADVSGHGVSAAIIAAMLKAFYLHHFSLALQPSRLLDALNLDLVNSIPTDNFVSAFYMVINRNQKSAIYSSASHPTPLLLSKKKKQVKALETSGFFLGVFNDGQFEEKSIAIEEGDRLLFYTDGVTEARNQAGESFGVNNLVNEMYKTNAMPFQKVLPSIQNAVNQFAQRSTFEDDITLLLLEMR